MDLNQNVICDIKKLAAKCNLDKVILFGSRAKSTNCLKSDIDLAISGGDTTQFTVDADDEIDTLLYIDVVVINEKTSAALLKDVAKDGVVLYEKI